MNEGKETQSAFPEDLKEQDRILSDFINNHFLATKERPDPIKNRANQILEETGRKEIFEMALAGFNQRRTGAKKPALTAAKPIVMQLLAENYPLDQIRKPPPPQSA